VLRPRVAARLSSALRSPRASSRLIACPPAAPKEAAPLVGGVRVDRITTTACSAVVCGPASAAARSGQAGHKAPRCRPPDSCLVRSTDLQGSASRLARRSERPRDHQPGDVRVHARPAHDPRAGAGGVFGPDGDEAIEGGKSAKEGKAMEDKGKGKAEEGQDTCGEGESSGRGGGRGEGKCRHGKQRA